MEKRKKNHVKCLNLKFHGFELTIHIMKLPGTSRIIMCHLVLGIITLEFGIKMNLSYSITIMPLYRRTTGYNRKDINPN
jgi:hypothetical protein